MLLNFNVGLVELYNHGMFYCLRKDFDPKVFLRQSILSPMHVLTILYGKASMSIYYYLTIQLLQWGS